MTEKPKDADWRAREQKRQVTRTLPVWQNELFWLDHTEIHVDHFVFLSQSNPPLLAYTQDESKGERDIQTPIKPGRYLKRFFGKILTEKQIKYLAAWQTNGARPASDLDDLEVQFATTEDDIGNVYKHGPDSCMDGDHFNGKNSPVRVYAAGDLAIAYLEGEAPLGRLDDDGKPSYHVLARALVWPDRKVAGRIYPTEGNHHHDGYGEDSQKHMAPHYALNDKLKALGYNFVDEGASFKDARLLKIRRNGEYVMPYLDHAYRVDHDGDHWVMSQSGDFLCDNTDGTIGEAEQDDPAGWCENCESNIMDEDDCNTIGTEHTRRGWHYQTWCENCRRNDSFFCEGFDESVADDVGAVEVAGKIFSRPYVEANFTFSNYSDDWFDQDSDPAVKVVGETWSTSELKEFGFTCEISGENYPLIQMHETHKGIHQDSTDDEIAEWLNANHPADVGRIEAAQQEEIAL